MLVWLLPCKPMCILRVLGHNCPFPACWLPHLVNLCCIPTSDRHLPARRMTLFIRARTSPRLSFFCQDFQETTRDARSPPACVASLYSTEVRNRESRAARMLTKQIGKGSRRCREVHRQGRRARRSCPVILSLDNHRVQHAYDKERIGTYEYARLIPLYSSIWFWSDSQPIWLYIL